MTQNKQRGFTIIEVSLFLAISASLLLIAFAFTGSTIRNVRFSDATKSLQSFLQQQYTRVQTNSLSLTTPLGLVPSCQQSGGIISSSSGSGMSNCMLLGVVLDMATNGTTVTVTPLLGYISSTNYTFSGVNPQLWTDAAEVYTLLWQSSVAKTASILQGSLPPQSKTHVDRLMFVRDLTTESINLYTLKQSDDTITSALTSPSPSNMRNVPTLVCIKSDDGGGLRGAVWVTGRGVESNTNINMISSSVVSQSEQFFTDSGVPGGVTCGV